MEKFLRIKIENENLIADHTFDKVKKRKQEYFNLTFCTGKIKAVALSMLFFLLLSYSGHAAVKTSAAAGNWNVAANWTSSGVPGSTDQVTVNNIMTLNADLTINSGGIYTFNSNSTGTMVLKMGDHLLTGGGDLNINAPAVVTMGSGDLYFGTIHVYAGATLNITGNLDITASTIIVDEGGILNVGGNFLNTNSSVVVNGIIAIGGKYVSNATALASATVTGTGSITSNGVMTNSTFLGSSTIFGSSGDCNAGPCNGGCIAGMTALPVTGPGMICSGTSNLVYTTNPVSGASSYVWTLPAGTVITSGANTRTITVTAGATSGNISVRPTNTTCAGTTASLAVTAGVPTGTAVISGAATACQSTGGFVYAVSGVNAATTYNWSVPSGASITSGAGTNTITVTMGTTAGAISVTPANICGNATGVTVATKAVALSVQPAAAIAYPYTTYCKNTTTQAPVITGTSGGTFSSSPTGLSMNSSTGIITGSSSTARAYTITYTAPAATGCSNATATQSITIVSTTLTAPSAITGASSSCQNGTGAYSITNIPAATSYDWKLPSGSTISSGSSTRSIGVLFGTASGVISVTPLTTCAGNTATVPVTVSPCAKTWNGSAGSDWSTAANWSPSIVPAATEDVTIANVASKPVVGAGATGNTKNLTINSGAGLTISSAGTVNVTGNVVNNGTFTASSGSTLGFTGTTAQTITGVPSIYNLNSNNAAGVSVLSPLVANGTISLLNGALTTNSNLTLEFDNGGNVGYAASDAGSISGNVAGRRNALIRTHYVAAPFNGVSSAQVGATTPLFYNGNWKMYVKSFDNQGWTAITDATMAMPLGTGYSVALPSLSVLLFSGTYNHNFQLTGTSYSNTVAGKYMLVGNPYPSTLDWSSTSGWTKTNIADAIYLWSASTNQISSWVGGITSGPNASKYIPAMQAFMVTTTGSGGMASLGINNNARVSNQNVAYAREGADETVRIKIQTENSDLWDDAVIRFNEMATNDFDPDFDAYKIINYGIAPSIYTTLGSTLYSINSVADPLALSSIPVSVKLPSDGNYILSVVKSDPAIDYVLIDKKLGIENLISGPGYTFVGLASDNTDRFELQLRTAVTTGIYQTQAHSGLKINSTSKGFVIQTNMYAANNARIEILDMTGKTIQVMAQNNLNSGTTFVPLDLADGAYLIKVSVEEEEFSGMISLTR